MPDWARELGAARRRLAGVARVTPVRSDPGLDAEAGATVLCKDEGAQLTGSFKLRGAWNALAAAGAPTGVVTYSSGNFGRALAHCARRRGLPAVVVCTPGTPEAKLARIRDEGAEVTLPGPGEEREAVAERLARERGLRLIPPFDDVRVIAGQGTVARELVEQAPGLHALVVPVSGGGLLAGCALAAHHSAAGRDVQVLGAEPAARPRMQASLRAGRPRAVEAGPTIADALRVTRPGEVTFPVVARLVAGVVSVSDDEIAHAMAVARERLGVRVEPGGAAGLAALLTGRLGLDGARVGVVLSGSNVEAREFERLARRREAHAAG